MSECQPHVETSLGRITVHTTTNLPTGSDRMPGKIIYVSDTAQFAIWTGDQWMPVYDIDTWVSWTPGILGGLTLGSGTATGQYLRMGSLVIFKGRITLAADSTISSSPSIFWPIWPIINENNAQVTGQFIDLAVNSYPVYGQTLNTSVFSMRVMTATGTYSAQSTNTSATVPFTWGNGDLYDFTGFCELDPAS